MNSAVLCATLLLMSMPMATLAAEKRCGWLENPTPANLWLIDAEGEWTISIQGSGFIDQDAPDRLPEIDDQEFVRTNYNYGFSCVCLQVETDRSRMEITRVFSGEQLLLKQCLEDPALQANIPLRFK